MMTKKDIEQLFRSNYMPMLTLACRLIHDEDEARDIVHDVFATLLSSNIQNVTTAYLLTSVRNGCVNHIRNFTTRSRIKNLYAVDLSEIEEGLWPDEAVISRLHGIVENHLPEQCRNVIKLRFLQGMSYREISRELSISEVAVYKHLRHALFVLRQNLRDNE